MYYCLFLKLGYLENQFSFNSGGEFILTVNCEHCSKSFRTKKQRSYYAWGCPKNPKGNKNRENRNKKRRKESSKDSEEKEEEKE